MTPTLRHSLIGTGMFTVLITALVYSLAMGPVALTLQQLATALHGDDGSTAAFVVRELRLPRALVSALVGAGLAVAGLIIQAVTRNPLGDPGLMGVSAGASFAVALAFITWGGASLFMLPAGMAGGLLALGLTLTLAYRTRFDPLHMVLGGMAVSIFFLAATSAVMIMHRTALQSLYFWMVGGFANRTFFEFSLLWPCLVVGFAMTALFGRQLDALSLGDELAKSFGIRLVGVRLGFLLVACLLTAACTAAAGPIGFIGFAVPHLTRWLLAERVRHLRLLPLVALNGAALSLTLDALTQSGLLGKPLPAGVYTALFGGILLLFFLKRLARS